MAIELRDDPDRVGCALLAIDAAREGALAVSIQFLDRTYLGPDGRRTRERHVFVAEPGGAPGTYSLGPPVTAHVPEAEVITLADQDGIVLGTVSWEGIRPPPGAGQGTVVGTRRAVADAPAVPGASSLPVRDEPAAPRAIEEAPPTTRPPPPRPVGRAGRAGMATLAALALALAAAADAALVLSGRLGWTLDLPVAAIAGVAGQVSSVARADARLRARWYAWPFASLVRHPFDIAGAPPWLALRTDDAGGGAVLHVRFDTAADALPPGEHRARVPIAFPLGGGGAGLAVDIVLHLDQPPPPPAAPKIAADVPAPSQVDDAACDGAAGNRFDPDHVAGHRFVDEVFDLPLAVVESGIAACDARTDRTGADRRLIVQRGRLLAARAVMRASTGDLAGARLDMNDAVAAWHAGSALGSAFADSLLGSYAFGTFNRPAITFTPPDDAAAVVAWQRGMARGSIVAQRNYAAQLLGGLGVAADPARAIGLLRDALARGDERAGGVLGVALYTGYPSGVERNVTEGWALITRAQCVDKPSADLLAAEIQRGARQASDRRSCG